MKPAKPASNCMLSRLYVGAWKQRGPSAAMGLLRKTLVVSKTEREAGEKAQKKYPDQPGGKSQWPKLEAKLVSCVLE